MGQLPLRAKRGTYRIDLTVRAGASGARISEQVDVR
jgi:hypothetical protein